MISGLIMLLFFLFSFSLIFNLLRQLLVKKKINQQQNIAFCSIYLFLLYFQNQSFHTYAGVCCYGVIPQRYLKNMCSVFSEFQFLAMSALWLFWCYNYNVSVWKGLQECSLDTYHEWTKKGNIFSKLQLFHFTFFNENFNSFCIGSYLWNRILTLKLPGQQNKWGGFVQLLNQMVSTSVWTVLGLFDFELLCAARWTAAQRSFKKKKQKQEKS